MDRIINRASTIRQSSSAAVLVPAIPTTDGELLMRYARHRDEAAFSQLVEKHGRLVWTVCWQILREHHAIEDAFQATFFILAKRARTIRSCDSLCGWLYRVAYRTALRARMNAKRKPLLELVADELVTLDESLRKIEQHEQRAVLMEELHSLPEQYQMPLIQCYLEGKSRRAAAEELGTTLETIKGQLARGRQLLRHRLIRRGVSLSLAMAAMALPVKSAMASVTPQLVGLTVTGCGKWLAGATTLASLKAAVSTSVSTQVVTLAHQGTVAMTLASLAKPAVVAVALLGAVSASLAVDSAENSASGEASQTVELAATTEADGETTNHDESEATITFTAADEGSTADAENWSAPATWSNGEQPQSTIRINGGRPDSKGELKYKKASNGTLVLTNEFDINSNFIAVREGELTVNPLPPEKPRRPALAEKIRVPAPARVATPMGVPAPPADVYMPVAPQWYQPQAFEFTNNFQFQDKSVIKQQLKIVGLQQSVAELQLQSKQLEIEAFDLEGEAKEQVLKESRKKLLEAEAEQLKIQVEQQRIQIEGMERAIKEQAKKAAENAKLNAEKAQQMAEEVAREVSTIDIDINPAKARMIEEAAEAKAQVIAFRARAVEKEARFAAERAANVKEATAHKAKQAAEVAEKSAKTELEESGALSLKPGDQILIRAVGASPDSPIDDVYVVEPMGTIPLGPRYGRVKVKGLSVIEAEKAIVEHLQNLIEGIELQVTYYGNNAPSPDTRRGR